MGAHIMSADDSKTPKPTGQKARGDAIRRLRDDRNAKINRPAIPGAPATPADQDHGTPTPSADDAPNYVEFIDRKMRERKKPDA